MFVVQAKDDAAKSAQEVTVTRPLSFLRPGLATRSVSKHRTRRSVQSSFHTTRLTGTTWLTFLFALHTLASLGASHLPDAALKIGTLQINQNAQFTTNTSVLLSVKGVNLGSSSSMQFSNDGQVWSAPEPYKTSRLWQLTEGGYPPRMNTVLKTVYVRFRIGTGAWTRAVTDSIILARTSADVPNVKEVWITQARPANYSSLQPLGSARNPHVVPRTTNEFAFDSLMHSLMTNFSGYYPAATGTNQVRPATNTTTLTLRLGPGTYETHGDATQHGAQLAWSPRNGWRIIGSGKRQTVLKAVHFTAGEKRSVLGHYSLRSKAVGYYQNFEISDLTIDANAFDNGTNNALRAVHCANFVGSNVQMRRVRAINAGTTIPGWEIAHLVMHNFGEEEDGTHNLIVEDCDFAQPQVNNDYPSGLLSICGEYGPSGNIHYYHGVIVRNCLVEGTPYSGNTPVDKTLYSVWNRGRYGIGTGGVRNAIFEDNLIQDVNMGLYTELGVHSILARNNHLRDVCFGFDLNFVGNSWQSFRLEDVFAFENNLVEFDPAFFPVRDTWQTRGRRYGFRSLGKEMGPADYSLNRIIVSNNTFRFTDGVVPHTNVSAHAGSLQAFRSAQICSNQFLGDFACLDWDNGPNILQRQIDLADSTSVPFMELRQNVTIGGASVDIYPHVLDRTLPRSVVSAGAKVHFQSPLFENVSARFVTGLPGVPFINSSGDLDWQSLPGDAGSYIISFYPDTTRSEHPRRTLLTVEPPYALEDSRWFAAGLGAYWKFNETEGSTLADSSGNGFHMDISTQLKSGRLALNQPGINASKALGSLAITNAGVAFFLKNSNPELLTGLPEAYHPLVNGPTRLLHPFAFSIWFKPGNPFSREGLLLNFPGAFAVAVRPHSADKGLVCARLANSTGDLLACTPTNITAGAWHHLAAVYDGVSAKLFVDGQSAAEDPFGQITGWVPGQLIYVGGGGASWGGFEGDLDELVIWNRALTGAEITRVYEMQRIGIEPPVCPLPPASLNLAITQEGDVNLSWTDTSSNESGYLVERSMDGVNFVPLVSLARNVTSLTDTPQVVGDYTYRVTATNGFGCAPPLNAGTPLSYTPVTNRLTLIAEGLGTLQPLNFTTNRLEIGQSYAVTALPAPGFVFAGWSDASGTVLGTNHNLTFTMQPRMVLTATFVDIQAPQLRFAEPLANARLTNGYVNLRGTATDNARITNVWVSVNTSWFQPARSTNEWTNWFLTQQRLAPGTNVLRAYAHDDSGRSSGFATNKVFLSVKSPLTLQTHGKGSIRRAFVGSLLEIGRRYSARAIPATGYVFSNWVGSVTSPNTSLSFLMQSNMTLQANFIPNPFKTAKGRYYGLFSAGTRAHDRSGAFSLSLTEAGGYSGSARIGTTYYRFAGKLDVAGNATYTVPRPGTNSLTIKLNVNLTPGIDQLTGSVSDGMWTASLLAHRAVFSATSNPARAYAGKYTVIVPGAVSTTLPRGNGFGAVSITTSGAVRLKGYLADDSPITQSSYISRDGLWPFYVPLYAGKGSICGWMSFDTNQPPDDLHGVISWIKPAVAGAKYYPSGFTRSVTAEGSRFYPAAYPGQLLSISNGVVRIEGGELAAPFSTGVALGKTGIPSTNGLTLRLIPTDGTFSGKFVMPDKSRTNILRGALFQNLNCGYGYSLGTNKTGEVFLSP